MNRTMAINQLFDFFAAHGVMTSQEFCAHPDKPYGIETVRRLRKSWEQLVYMYNFNREDSSEGVFVEETPVVETAPEVKSGTKKA
jgi:hypothetical protein